MEPHKTSQFSGRDAKYQFCNSSLRRPVSISPSLSFQTVAHIYEITRQWFVRAAFQCASSAPSICHIVFHTAAGHHILKSCFCGFPLCYLSTSCFHIEKALSVTEADAVLPFARISSGETPLLWPFHHPHHPVSSSSSSSSDNAQRNLLGCLCCLLTRFIPSAGGRGLKASPSSHGGGGEGVVEGGMLIAWHAITCFRRSCGERLLLAT